MNIEQAKKLLRGTKHEDLSDEDVELLIIRLKPFMELVAEKIIEYQSTIRCKCQNEQLS